MGSLDQIGQNVDEFGRKSEKKYLGLDGRESQEFIGYPKFCVFQMVTHGHPDRYDSKPGRNMTSHVVLTWQDRKAQKGLQKDQTHTYSYV